MTARHFNEELPLLGLPLALCPTCCREGTARLRVVTLRNPFARLASYWREWKQRRLRFLSAVLYGITDMNVWGVGFRAIGVDGFGDWALG
eukprot:s642_g9.t1